MDYDYGFWPWAALKRKKLLSPLATAKGHLPKAIVYTSKSFNLVIVSIVFTSPSIGL